MDNKMTKLKIPNAKGKNITAVVHYPAEETEKLAILCPGYLASKDYDHLILLADALAAHGYTTIRFDPIGTWESDGDIAGYNTTQYLNDVKTVLEYALQKRKYDNILLGGHSDGGMISILYAAKDSRISELLAIMPPSNRSMLRKKKSGEWEQNGFRVSKRNTPNSTKEKEFRVPFSFAEDRNKYDVTKDVGTFRVPIVLIAGELDNINTPEDVKKIYDNANEPKKFILLKGIGHDYRFNPSEIKVVNDKILEALSDTIKVGK